MKATGNIEPFKVAVFNRDNSFTQFKQYIGTLTSITDDCQYGINADKIDLSDFGVSEGDSISIVRVDNLGSPGCCTGADISDIIRVR